MKPILFNTEMVRAILNGRKTVTRRLVKPRYREGEAGFYVVTGKYTGDFRYIETYDEDESGTDRRINPPCFPGDILYVRETWAKCQNAESYVYKADFDGYAAEVFLPRMKWHPSIHMPKEAARIFLRVTNVHVERLIDSFRKTGDVVSDFAAEGVDLPDECETCLEVYGNPCCNDLNEALPYDDATGEDTNGGSECGMLEEVIQSFADLWDSTIKPDNLSCSGFSANPWVWVIEFERCEKPKEEA